CHVAERALDEPEEFVALAEQPRHQVVAGHTDLHLRRSHGNQLEAYPCPPWRSRVIHQFPGMPAVRSITACSTDSIDGWPTLAATTLPRPGHERTGSRYRPTNRRRSWVCSSTPPNARSPSSSTDPPGASTG